MRFLLVLAFATVSLAAAVLPHQNEIDHSLIEKTKDVALNSEEIVDELDLDFDEEDEYFQYPIQRGPILNWQVKSLIRTFVKDMPCGAPQYGIPPLAPLKLREGEISLKKGLLETTNKIFHFLVDGLDKMKIKKFKLNAFKRYAKFDFLFHNIVISAEKYETNTILDGLQKLGLYVHYEGEGTVKFSAKNLRITGILHYKLPLFVGSAQIKSLKTEISAEKFTSSITGLLGGGEAINHLINSQIEHFFEKKMNENEDISNFIDELVMSKVNENLKGVDFWTLIDRIFSTNENEDDPIVSNCVAPADPWA